MAREVSDSEIRGVSKSTPLNETKMRSETKYRKQPLYKNLSESGESLNKEFSVTKSTEQTLAETVQRMFGTFKDSKATGPLPINSSISQFVTDFKKQYPGMKDDELKDKALEFVRSSPQALAVALKLTEWELATLQKSTGAWVDGDRPMLRYHDHLYVDRNADKPNKLRLSARFSEWIMRPEHPEDQNLYYRIRIRDRDISDTNVVYSTRGLDNAQIQYLESINRYGINAVITDPSEANAEKQRLAGRIDQITKARSDFYTAIGRPRGTIRPNTITSDGRYLSRIQAAYLDAEQKGPALGVNTRDRVYAEINLIEKEITDRIKKETTQRLKEEREKKEENLLGSIVRENIRVLDRPKVLTPEQTRRRDQLEEERKKRDEELTKIKRRIDHKKTIDESTRERDTIRSAINSAVNTASGGTYPDIVDQKENRVPQLNSEITTFTTRLNGAEAERVSLNKTLDEERSNLTKTSGRISGGASQEIRDAATAEKPEIEGRITQLESQIDRLNKKIEGDSTTTPPTVGLEDEVKVRKDELAGLNRYLDQDAIKTQFDELQKKNDAIFTNQIEFDKLTNLEAEIRARDPSLATVTLEELKAYLEEEVSKLQAEKLQISGADVEQAYLRSAFHAYEKHLLPSEKSEEISNRVRNRNKIKFDYARDYYRDYPEAYIRTLQLMFGEESVSSGHQQLFSEASNLLSPDLFAEIYNEGRTPPVNIFTLDQKRDVNSALIRKIRSRLNDDVRKGFAGRLSIDDTERAAMRTQLERMQAIGKDVAFTPPETDVVDYEKRIYFYKTDGNLQDLTRRIIDQWNITDSTDYFDPTHPRHREQIAKAKRFAEAIDAARKKRLGLNSETSAVTSPIEEEESSTPTP